MRRIWTVALLTTSMMASPVMAMAQSDESAALRAELDALRAQMAAMQHRLDALDAQAAHGSADEASRSAAASIENSAIAPTPSASAPALPAPASSDQIVWRGAPEWKNDAGWSFKPRGRIQVDFAGVDSPAGVTEDRGGLRTELRRIYFGADGKIPGGFSYRVEADFANGIELTDAYLRYGTGPAHVSIGHMKTFSGLDDMTSDLYLSLMERASFTQAFGFQRRVGIAGQYAAGDMLLQGGVFGANAEDLADDKNNAIAADLRVVWSPNVGDDILLHLGGSLHMRNLNDSNATVRYRARPGAHTTDLRLVDTGNIAAKGERSFGLEAAVRHGPFHAMAEGYWQKVRRIGGADPSFFGGYAELGMVLTKGDQRGYKEGAFDRLKPSRPITKGGPGAIEVNLRYDHISLNDQDIIGGKQQTAWIGLVWAPIDYVRLTANYGRMWISDARVAAADGRTKYQADTLGLRTQIDF